MGVVQRERILCIRLGSELHTGTGTVLAEESGGRSDRKGYETDR